jgi:hypothetical protein
MGGRKKGGRSVDSVGAKKIVDGQDVDSAVEICGLGEHSRDDGGGVVAIGQGDFLENVVRWRRVEVAETSLV